MSDIPFLFQYIQFRDVTSARKRTTNTEKVLCLSAILLRMGMSCTQYTNACDEYSAVIGCYIQFITIGYLFSISGIVTLKSYLQEP